jgi:cytidylate kinase
MSNTIITIGREFGSGGRELGRRLAEELGYEYYDREILEEISRRTDLSVEYVHQIVENQPHSLLPITVGRSFTHIDHHTLRQLQAVYREQTKVIREMAAKSNCVIVGRCASYILRSHKPFRIFVHASLDSRLRRCMEHLEEGEHLTEREMRRHIKAMDKGRAKYFRFYTEMKWGDKANYDLCINTTDVVIKDIVPVIAKLFKN